MRRILTLQTIREFASDEEWQAYKRWSPMNVNWGKVEDIGQDIVTAHREGEAVKTIISLEERP